MEIFLHDDIAAAGIVEVFDRDRAPQAALAVLERRYRASRQRQLRRVAGDIEEITNLFVLRHSGQCTIGFELPQPPIDRPIDDVVLTARRKDLVFGARPEEGDPGGRTVFTVVFNRAVAITRDPMPALVGSQLDRYIVGNRRRPLHPSLDFVAGSRFELHDAPTLRVRETAAEG